jgi:hypothetical protein
VTNHFAELTWDVNSGVQSYNVRYRVVGSNSWTDGGQILVYSTTVTTLFADIDHLQPGTNYEWQVQAVCSGTNSSSFSASNNFTTAQYTFTANFKNLNHTYTPDTITVSSQNVGGAVCFSSTGGYQYLSGTDNSNGKKINVNCSCNYGGVSTNPTITVIVNGITYSSNPLPNGRVTGNAPATYYGCTFLTFNANVYNPSNTADSFAVTGNFVGDYFSN